MPTMYSVSVEADVELAAGCVMEVYTCAGSCQPSHYKGNISGHSFELVKQCCVPSGHTTPYGAECETGDYYV